MPKKIEIATETLECTVKEAISYSDVARKLGVSVSWICRKVKKLNIDISHFSPYENREAYNKLDLVGLKFNRWTVLEFDHMDTESRSTYWKCICECGNEGIRKGSSLKTGHTKSCGCLRSEKARENLLAFHPHQIKYSPVEATARRAFKNYQLNDRDIIVQISFEDFYKYSQNNCYYCNAEPSNCFKSERRERGDFIYNGLDRINSSLGYIATNIVPCCKYCNKAKCELSVLEFKMHLNKLLGVRDKLSGNSFVNLHPPSITQLPIPINRPTNYKDPFVGEIVPNLVLGKLTVLGEAPNSNNRKLLCRCACGSIREVNSYNLRKGSSRACNDPLCFQKFPSFIYKARAIWMSRYRDKDLSFEDFYSLAQMDCAYCDDPPAQIVRTKDNKAFIYNGLDRLDPLLGHTTNNVVACCYTCNKAKNDRSLTEFDNWLTAINNHWLSKY